MGVQGPLTAQALGRSPYDEIIYGTREADRRVPEQQYDERGRPVNPATKQMNKDIIRAHNEVMAVIGVAEADHPTHDQEHELRIQHELSEEQTAKNIAFAAKWSLDAIGIFGAHGLRQRTLVYTRFSEMPFWQLYQNARKQYSWSQLLFPGAPGAICICAVDRLVLSNWFGRVGLTKWALRVWPYFKIQLKLFVLLQRLGLIPAWRWFPKLAWFVPFSSESPLLGPPLPSHASPGALLQWMSGVMVANAPFVVWVAIRRLVQQWDFTFWKSVSRRLSRVGFSNSNLGVSPPSQNNSAPHSIPSEDRLSGETVPQNAAERGAEGAESAGPQPNSSSHNSDPFNEVYSSDDDDDREVVTGTLISLDVESSLSSNVSQSFYSAELRPSQAPEAKSKDGSRPVYRVTWLTRFPQFLAGDIFTHSVMRIVFAPFEAFALRLVARGFCVRAGLPYHDIHPVSFLGGLNLTSIINFLGSELLHLALSGEVWALSVSLAQHYHMTDAEWKERHG